MAEPSPSIATATSCHDIQELSSSRQSSSLPRSPLLSSRQHHPPPLTTPPQTPLCSGNPPRACGDAVFPESAQPNPPLIDQRSGPDSCSSAALNIELQSAIKVVPMGGRSPVRSTLLTSSAELGGKDNHLLGGSRDLLRIENYKRLLGKSTEQVRIQCCVHAVYAHM